MAKQYPIPASTREKEKIIGGVFTLTQAIFLGLALILGIGGGLLAYKMTNNLIVPIFVVLFLGVPFLPFSFVTFRKYGDIELYQFVILKLKYRLSTKKYINVPENTRKEITIGE